MKNDTYVESLPATLSRDNILDDVRGTRAELHDSTIPSYQNAVELWSSDTFKSEAVTGLVNTFTRIANVSGATLPGILNGIEDTDTNLRIIEDMVKKTFNKDLATSAITLKETNILQFIEAASFVSRFSRRLLVFIYAAETALGENTSLTLEDSFSVGEIAFLTDNILNFAYAFNSVTGKPTKLVDQLNDIPEVVVNRDTIRNLNVTLGEKKLDPFNTRYFDANVTNNFVYKLMLFFADRQVKRYKQASEEKRLLELRHLFLQRQRKGQVDARLEKEIGIVEDRIKRLSYQLTKLEQANV